MWNLWKIIWSECCGQFNCGWSPCNPEVLVFNPVPESVPDSKILVPITVTTWFEAVVFVCLFYGEDLSCSKQSISWIIFQIYKNVNEKTESHIFHISIIELLVAYCKYGNFLFLRHPVTILVTDFTNSRQFDIITYSDLLTQSIYSTIYIWLKD